MVVEDRSEFRPGQRVRVREERGDRATQPDERWLGKEGTIAGPGPSRYWWVVFIDSREVVMIGTAWLQSAE